MISQLVSLLAHLYCWVESCTLPTPAVIRVSGETFILSEVPDVYDT